MLKPSFLTKAFTFGLFLTVSPYVWGHGDEPHGEPAVSSSSQNPSDIPQRIVVSKSDQFKHQLLSLIVSAQEGPALYILPGKLMPSPQGYAQIQVAQPSRVVIDPNFPMPNPGDTVEANQVVAVLEPLLSTGDLTARKSELYKVESEIATLKREVERLTALKNFAPKKQLENTQIELDRAVKQRDQLLGTGLGREFLRAPLKGRVGDSHLLPGQVVQPGQLVLEIINPQELRVEAYTYNYPLAEKVKQAYLKDPFKEELSYSLKNLGFSPRVGEKDQVRHILFSLSEAPSNLMMGMAVDILVESTDLTKKILVPQEALIKKGNTYIAVVFTEPEVLTQRSVEIGRLIDGKVEILSNLEEGEKILKDVSILKTVLKKA